MSAKLSGKQKCEMLRNIRREIAARNNIEYITSDCTYEGDCLGTCPKCDAEVRYLENELNRKIQSGQQVSVAGINDNFVQLIDQVETTVMDFTDTEEESSSEHELRGKVLPPMDTVYPDSYEPFHQGDAFPPKAAEPPEDNSPIMGYVAGPVSPDGRRKVPRSMPIKELGLNPITYIKLKMRGFRDVNDLCSMCEKALLTETRLNEREIAEIKAKLEKAGRSLSRW